MPTILSSLADCVEVACGTAVSYAVTKEGHCYSWGMGTNGQLGTGDEVSQKLGLKVVRGNCNVKSANARGQFNI